ncbi:MAG: TonB-dependent receptor [Cyclobacteriaceae bacterium]|nr:TonB-dependent receptor [Cyclobacteriaceae bacterium]
MCLAFMLIGMPLKAQHIIRGMVADKETRESLPYATVSVVGTSHGVVSDESGNFSFEVPQLPVRLVISFSGYQADTIDVTSSKTLTCLLKPDIKNLNEIVVVSGTLKEVSRLQSPIPVDVYTPALFRKNPSPSVFESLSMINGVQPQINCNVCNTGDIHINGMEGPYTMVLIDGMPIVSSLSTVYGLAGIPNSMVKRIEVVKGPASTLYGSEAVAGVINIITKDPLTAPRLAADFSATTYQEYALDLSSCWKKKNISALTGLSYFNFSNRVDYNADNFTDVTLQNRLSVFSKLNINRKSKLPASIGLRYVYEDRWGGEMQWNKNFRGSDQIYGESIYTNRLEVIGNYTPAGLPHVQADISYNYHHQDSYYGTVPYLASQHVFFSQLRWTKKKGSTDVLAGLPFRYMYYDDNSVATASADTLHPVNEPHHTILPGVFIQTETTLGKAFTLLSGLRYDHHNHHGPVFTPRISLKYNLNTNQVLRVTGGSGFRVVNLFTEDHAALTGAREVIIRNKLKPEQSWNINLNYAATQTFSSGYLNLDVSAFYTYFTNKIVGDFMTDPDLIIYDNLSGYAVSKGVSLNADFLFASTLKLMAGITAMNVYQINADSAGRNRTPQLFAPRLSGTFALSYTVPVLKIATDLTGRITGPMYLPVVPNDERPEKSPTFALINIQFSKTVGKWEIYAGLKNLLNFVPKHPILRPFDPFDRNITVDNPKGFTFDTSYNYAPVQGVRGFAGLRYTMN